MSQRDTGETRDIRILQRQLDLARSTIDTLKEELNVKNLLKMYKMILKTHFLAISAFEL